MKKLVLAFAACAAAFCGTVAFADGGSDVTTHPSGDWVVTKLTGNGDDCVITDGTLKYAYAPTARTVNGVTFVANSKLVNATDDIEAVPAFGYDKGDHNNNDPAAGALPSGGWRDLLGSGWLNNGSKPADSTFTFKDLTKGNIYKVQLLVHNGNNIETPARSIFSPDGQEGFYGKGKDGSHADWALGCSLVGTFVATNTEHQLTFSYSRQAVGWKNLNAIQLRDLGAYVPMSINARAANMIPGDWIVCPMAGEPGDIVTRGDLVQKGGYGQAFCSVDIPGDDSLAGLSFKGMSYGFVENYSCFQADLWGNYKASDLGDCGVAGGYGTLLANGWAGNNQQPGRVLNLNSIEAGKLYLLQGIVHDGTHPGHQLTIANKTITYGAADSSEAWYYGGTFVHLFKATGSSMAIDLSYTPYGALLNGVQLRQLPDVTMPSIGKASAEVEDVTATITILDVVIGMGWDTSAATSYDVYAKLNDKEFSKVAEDVTETTASFVYEDLDSGVYDCTIYIVNDKGVQSAEKVVSFEVGSSEPQTYVVTKATDSLNNPEEGSLRWVLSKVRAGDTVTFDKEQMGTDTIKIVGVNTAKADTTLIIRKAVTIEGNGVTIDGGWDGGSKNDTGGRIFLIPEGLGEVLIRNLTMQNGHGRGWNGGSGWSFSDKYFQGGAMCALSPVRFENCSFIHNCSADETHAAPDGAARGGGAIYAVADVELESCHLLTNCIPTGSSSYGGAVFMAGGSLVARKCVFDTNYTDTFCGGLFAAEEAQSVLLEDCMVAHSSCVGGNNVNGGFMWSKIKAGDGRFVRFSRCAFRDNCVRSSGGYGGVLYAESGAPVIVTDCEFTDNRAHTGGSIRSHGTPTIYVNCTFTGGAMTGDTWGPALDMRQNTYVINCTFGGNMFLDNKNSGGGSATASGAAAYYLNCVCAYNYRNVGEGVSDAVVLNGDIGKFGGNWTLLNTVANGKDADGKTDLVYASSLDDVKNASKLFTDYQTINKVKIYANSANLKDDYVVPAFAEDKKNEYRSRVFSPVKGGILDGAGWPVKVNADYTHICYSADGGTTWTDLYKNGTPDDSTLELITKDQRGVAYYKGKTPIGAATVEPSAGMYLIIR